MSHDKTWNIQQTVYPHTTSFVEKFLSEKKTKKQKNSVEHNSVPSDVINLHPNTILSHCRLVAED